MGNTAIPSTLGTTVTGAIVALNSKGSNLRWVARNDSLSSSSGTTNITIAGLKNFKELQMCVSYYDGRVLESQLIRYIEGNTVYRAILFSYYDSGNYISVYFDLDISTGNITFHHYRQSGSVTVKLIGYFIAT